MVALRTLALLVAVAAAPACALQARGDLAPKTEHMPMVLRHGDEDPTAFVNETMDSLVDAVVSANGTITALVPEAIGTIKNMLAGLADLQTAADTYSMLPGADKDLSATVAALIKKCNSTALAFTAKLAQAAAKASSNLNDYIAKAWTIADKIFTIFATIQEDIELAQNATEAAAVAAREAEVKAALGALPRALTSVAKGASKVAKASSKKTKKQLAAKASSKKFRMHKKTNKHKKADSNQTNEAYAVATSKHVSFLLETRALRAAPARLSSLDRVVSAKGGKQSPCAKGETDLQIANKTVSEFGDLISGLNGTATGLIEQSLGAVSDGVATLNGTIAAQTAGMDFLNSNPVAQKALATLLEALSTLPATLSTLAEQGLAEMNKLVDAALPSLASGFQVISDLQADVDEECEEGVRL